MQEKVKFSQRIGKTPVKSIQIESMDDALRNSLWNILDNFFWYRTRQLRYLDPLSNFEGGRLWEDLHSVQREYFKKTARYHPKFNQ
ncbi:MAG: hypothetical protein HY663_00830 [Chloroflexi bacterium]|nr:hypothetical protein [Chloroflexota bacterium]